jgi:glycosyltransferase involved in cell wall biosynthesis
VDSGSQDGSVKLAESLGAVVVKLDLTRPFTAARARNEGFERLMQIDSNIEAVQFVDGDCEIASGWIHAASHALSANPQAAVICGRRRERFPEKSIYNRLCDLEWNTPVGEAIACGGDALIRVSAFKEVAGYNAAVIAGEEPEMCVRLRQRGWTIQRIDHEMTLHDAAIAHIWQWWKRTVRSGHAYAEGYAMHGTVPEFFRKREVQSIEFWAVWPVIATAILLALFLLTWPKGTALGLLPLLMYPLLVMKILWNRRGKGPFGDQLLYAVSVVAGKFPQHLGMRMYRRDARRGRSSEIIEYKRMAGPSNGLIIQGGHDVP